MKRTFFLVIFLLYSLFSIGQLDSIIKDILKYKSIFMSLTEEELTINVDSIQKVHEEQIYLLANQKQLEFILDTTNSIDLKFYCAQTLVHYPSDKISNVFWDILKDTNSYQEYDVENSCITYSVSIRCAPWYKAVSLLSDSNLTKKSIEFLEKEIFQMDSIYISNLWFTSNGDELDYDEFLSEIVDRNIINKNPKVSQLMMKVFFENRINRFFDRVYGNGCGIVSEPPTLRSYLEYSLTINDSSDIEFERKNEVYYFSLWLNSEHREIQVYGAEALIRLQNLGVDLNEEQIKKINKLKRSRRKVKTCGGCTYGEERIREALSGFELK